MTLHPYCAAAVGKPSAWAVILRSRARQAAKQNDAIRFTIPPAWLCHAVPPLHKGGCGVPPLAYCAPALGNRAKAGCVLGFS